MVCNTSRQDPGIPTTLALQDQLIPWHWSIIKKKKNKNKLMVGLDQEPWKINRIWNQLNQHDF